MIINIGQSKVLRLNPTSSGMFLQCKVCGKEFPEYDQRGFRNAGFTAHQNRCVSKTNAAARDAGGSGKSGTGTGGSISGSSEAPRRPSRPRRLLPAPPRRLSQPQLSSSASPGPVPFFGDQRPREFLQQPHRIDFFPVQQCDYCDPQQGFHNPSCIFLQFIMDLTNDAPPTYDPSSPEQ